MRQVYEATPGSVGHARHAVSEFATEVGAHAEAVRAICLAVTEACANVAVHAYRDRVAPGEMVVAASEADGDLSVSVVDHGLGLTPRPDSPGIGMGMPLMSQLSDKLEVQTSEGTGTSICMRFNLRARPSLTLAHCT
jgi:anti-sigma regulatory factor (Ser/Thr protein kinase)